MIFLDAQKAEYRPEPGMIEGENERMENALTGKVKALKSVSSIFIFYSFHLYRQFSNSTPCNSLPKCVT